jgi:hypothetical protein
MRCNSQWREKQECKVELNIPNAIHQAKKIAPMFPGLDVRLWDEAREAIQ